LIKLQDTDACNVRIQPRPRVIKIRSVNH